MNDDRLCVVGAFLLMLAVIVCMWADNHQTAWSVTSVTDRTIVMTRRVNDGLFSSHWEFKGVWLCPKR